MAASKDELRARCTAARRARSADDREAARARVRAVVLARAAAADWARVAAYVPLPTEPGSVELLDGLVSRGVRVLVPLTLPDRDLDWVVWGSTLPLGVAEVATVDAVLVPALTVATDGTRLGRGGGSYDRALARCAAGVTLAALLFDGELAAALPREPWDVPVTDVVTPLGWRRLSPAGAGNTGVADSG